MTEKPQKQERVRHHPCNQLWGELTGILAADLKTADESYTIPAGTTVYFQFDINAPLVVVPAKTGAQRSITASLKEVAGSTLIGKVVSG